MGAATHRQADLQRRRGRRLLHAGPAASPRQSGAAPDLQLHFAPAFFYDHGRAEAPAPCFTIGPTLLQPESRGHLAITTADPFAPPAIHGNYLDSARDLELLETGCALAVDIAEAPPLQRHARGRRLPQDTTRAGLRRHVREELQTVYHPTSTCAMGVGDDAVVDPELRVRGVDGLRIADASVMPAVPHGNTNAPTVMIAERASDLIAGRSPLPPADLQ